MDAPNAFCARTSPPTFPEPSPSDCFCFWHLSHLFAGYVSLYKWRIKQNEYRGLANYVTAMGDVAYVFFFLIAIALAIVGILEIVKVVRTSKKQEMPFYVPFLSLIPGAIIAYGLLEIILRLITRFAQQEAIDAGEASVLGNIWLGLVLILIGVVLSLIVRRLQSRLSDNRLFCLILRYQPLQLSPHWASPLFWEALHWSNYSNQNVMVWPSSVSLTWHRRWCCWQWLFDLDVGRTSGFKQTAVIIHHCGNCIYCRRRMAGNDLASRQQRCRRQILRIPRGNRLVLNVDRAGTTRYRYGIGLHALSTNLGQRPVAGNLFHSLYCSGSCNSRYFQRTFHCAQPVLLIRFWLHWEANQ